MKILITGGNGFIGSHLAENLLLMGHEVILFDITFGNNTERLKCPKLEGDVCEPRNFHQVPNNIDLIFHAAAVSRVEWGEIDPEKCLRTNVLGSLNTIRWAIKNGGSPHFIHASSREVYGESTLLPVTENHLKNPVSIYGVSKLAAEQLLSHYGRVSGLRFTITRFSNAYGSPRDLPERVIPRFTNQALNGEPLTLNGGDQVLDFTFIDDLIDGLLSLVKHVEDRGESVLNTDINFATRVGTSVKELAGLLKEVTNSSSEILVGLMRGYDVTKFVGDNTKAKRLLGFTPKVSLREGLKKYVERIST